MKEALKQTLKRWPVVYRPLRRLKHAIAGPPPAAPPLASAPGRTASDHWSEVAASEIDRYGPEVYWLAHPAIRRHYESKAVAGLDYPIWVEYCVGHFLGDRIPVDRMLSIGCGDGVLERHLAGLGAYKACDGLDIAPGMIDSARQKAREAGLDNVRYFQDSAETKTDYDCQYDAIWFNMALHHLERLEETLQRMSALLRSDGILFIHEYIGPNRFALSPREKQAIQATFQLIPPQYRRYLRDPQPYVLETCQIPDPADVEKMDPSESIRSADIVSVLRHQFDILAFNPCGGTLLHFLMDGICGNFREDDPASMRILQMIFDIEDSLIESGDLQSHFAVIVARPKA